MKKIKKMKKIKFVLILAFIFSYGCSSQSYYKLRIDIPAKPTLNLNQFNEIVITNFLIKKETKDIDLNQELINYLTTEIGQKFKGKVSSKNISFGSEDVFNNEDFWKNLSPELKRSLLLTGSVQYTEEIRKAILAKKRSRFEEPFPPEKALSERRFYTLNLDLFLIDTESGKILYKRSFKESKGYENPKQTSYFAFFDLVQAVKGKLFSNILGERKIQERYLISH